MSTKLTLTDPEKKELENSGYSKQDIQCIVSAIKKTTYALVQQDGTQLTIGPQEALERLGREEWIRGIARSAFYVDTTRYGLNGERISLHSKVYI